MVRADGVAGSAGYVPSEEAVCCSEMDAGRSGVVPSVRRRGEVMNRARGRSGDRHEAIPTMGLASAWPPIDP